MASTLVQFRTEDTEKLKSVQILEKLGLSLPAYLRMCMSRLNQENGIPFSMKLEEEQNPGINKTPAFVPCREQAGSPRSMVFPICHWMKSTRKLLKPGSNRL